MHEVAAGGGVVAQPVSRSSSATSRPGDDQHRQLGGHRGGLEKSAAVRPDDLLVVDQPRRHTSLERAAVEGFEDPWYDRLIHVRERSDGRSPRAAGSWPGRPAPTWTEPNRAGRPGRPAAARRPADPAIWKSAPRRLSSRVDPAGLLIVRQDAAPVGLGAEVEGVPVPVLDHLGAAGDERPGGLPPLAVVGRAVRRTIRRWRRRWSR